MPARVDPYRVRSYDAARDQGWSIRAAARYAHVSPTWAWQRDQELQALAAQHGRPDPPETIWGRYGRALEIPCYHEGCKRPIVRGACSEHDPDLPDPELLRNCTHHAEDIHPSHDEGPSAPPRVKCAAGEGGPSHVREAGRSVPAWGLRTRGGFLGDPPLDVA